MENWFDSELYRVMKQLLLINLGAAKCGLVGSGVVDVLFLFGVKNVRFSAYVHRKIYVMLRSEE